MLTFRVLAVKLIQKDVAYIHPVWLMLLALPDLSAVQGHDVPLRGARRR